MKRLLAVLLIMCMAVSVCACGKKEKIYKVGDTVSTERAEVTMKETGFSEFRVLLTGNEEKARKNNIEKDRIYYNFEYELKNIGDTVLNEKMRNPDGYPYSNQLGAYVDLYYAGEKYVALNSSDIVLSIVSETSIGSLEFNVPVGGMYHIVGSFELPRKAITDDEPIYVHIKLPNSKGEFEIFKFKLK